MTCPTLLLLHAAGTSSAQWDPNKAVWDQQPLRPLAIDLPGHGSRASEPFILAAALDYLEETIAAQARPLVLVGHSLGGYIASLIAGSRPDLIDALVLSGVILRIKGWLAANGPALIINGADDREVVACQQQLVQPIPGSRLVTVASAGHVVNLDAPEYFSDAVATFAIPLSYRAERPG